MKKKTITAVLFTLLIILLLGIPAFAEEPAVTETPAAEVQEGPLPEVIITEPEHSLAEPEAVASDPSVEIPADSELSSEDTPVIVAEEEPEPGPQEESQEPSEPEAPEETVAAVTEEPADTPAVQEPEPEETVPEETAEETPITPAAEDCAPAPVSYVVTVSDGSRSVDLTGGSANSVSEILTTLGYDVTGAVITFDPESVDTNVIYLRESEEGLFLGDNGPFSRADRNLVVYVNGEPVELTVVDPVEIGDKDNPSKYAVLGYSEVTDAFSAAEDGNVRLVSDIEILGNGAIELPTGSHDLYLNGHSLNLNDAYFNVQSGSVLNIYGGTDDTTTGGEGKIFGTSDQYINICGGDVNLYGGTVGYSHDRNIPVFAQSGTVSIYDGSIDVSEMSGTAIVLQGNSAAMIYGGTLKGMNAIDFRPDSSDQTIAVHVFGGMINGGFPAANSSQYIEVVGGTFRVDPTPYLLNGNGDSQWSVSESGGLYTVSPSQNRSAYACVFYSDIYQHMQSSKTLGDALNDCPDQGTIVLLKDLNYELEYKYEKTVTLDLYGKILRVSGTASNPGSVITVSGSNSRLTLADSAPGAPHTDASLPHGGIVTGGVGDKSQEAVSRGGGVTIKNGGTFTMNGGTITGNTAVHGGGVYIDDSSSFIMNGGTICNNTADYHGGGVFMSDQSTFTMNGGKITGNSALVASGVFALGTMTVGGTASVTGNMSADTATECNVCIIKDGNLLGTQADFQGKVGVTLFSSSSDFTPSTGKFSLPSSQIHGIYFTSDISDYYVLNSDCNSVIFSTKYPVAKVVDSTGIHMFDTVQNAVNAKGSGSEKNHAFVEIQMIQNSQEAVLIDVYQEIVLTMNGHVLFMPETGERTISVLGKLVLQSGLVESTALEDDSVPANAIDGGGVYNKGLLQLIDITLRNCVVTGTGGAVENRGVFEMNGGNIINNSAVKGAGVYNVGTFTMNGGNITNNNGTSGAGVYNVGTFTMNGGTIKGNIATYRGGGVYNEKTFRMTAGTIEENRAGPQTDDIEQLDYDDTDAGGVYNSGTMFMTGGRIRNNRGTLNGGIFNGGWLEMTGGIITGNLAFSPKYCYYWISDGVFCSKDASIVVGGTAVIRGNGKENLMLYKHSYGKCLIISHSDAPKEGMRIHVCLFNGHDLTSGHITEWFSGTAKYAKYFFPDYDYDSGYGVRDFYAAIETGDLFKNIKLEWHDYPYAVDFDNGREMIAMPTDILVDTAIPLDSLPDAQRAAVKNMLEEKGKTLVCVVHALMVSDGTEGSFLRIKIQPETFGGYTANQLTVWYLNEDNTLTQVPYEIIDGAIIVSGGKAGVYVLAA